MAYFRFEKLEVWKDAKEFVTEVYSTTSKFPSSERFGLVDQTRRASVSIVLNIAEGSTRGWDADFRRYLKMAQGSINEVVTGFYIALDLKLLSQGAFDKIYEQALRLNGKLSALIKKVSN